MLVKGKDQSGGGREAMVRADSHLQSFKIALKSRPVGCWITYMSSVVSGRSSTMGKYCGIKA